MPTPETSRTELSWTELRGERRWVSFGSWSKKREGNDERVSASDRDAVSPLSGTFLTAVSGSSVTKTGEFRVEEGVEGSVAGGVDDVVGDDDVAAATLGSL